MVLCALAATYIVLVSQGQTIKPPNVDFSGRWSLVNEGTLGILGKSVTLTQTPTTLTVERPDMPAEKYALNGETRTTFPPPGDQATHNPETTLWSYVTRRVSVSGWANDQLVIVTHQFNRVNSPGATPREFDAEWTYRLKLSLDDGGRLIVESDRIMDPLPQPTRLASGAQSKPSAFPKESMYVKER